MFPRRGRVCFICCRTAVDMPRGNASWQHCALGVSLKAAGLLLLTGAPDAMTRRRPGLSRVGRRCAHRPARIKLSSGLVVDTVAAHVAGRLRQGGREAPAKSGSQVVRCIATQFGSRAGRPLALAYRPPNSALADIGDMRPEPPLHRAADRTRSGGMMARQHRRTVHAEQLHRHWAAASIEQRGAQQVRP